MLRLCHIELKGSGYRIGGSNRDRIESDRISFKKIGHWIVGFMKMRTALNFVKIFEINRVACSKKINRTENLSSQLIISTSPLESSLVQKLYIPLNNQKVSGSNTQVLVNSIFQNNKYQIDCEKIGLKRIEQKIVDRFSSSAI